ncbi:hypothetical protein KAH94_01820 [bacterium]|nr:hypothetical protein [bacterium]
MKHDMRFVGILALFLLMMPGCGGRIVDWGKQHVKQGNELKKDKTLAQNYIRSFRCYDQFTLLGAFDSIWLSDDVRLAYSDLYAMKHGKNEDQKKIFLRRQLEENNHFLSFYILTPADIILGEKDSEWTVLLKIDDYTFVPTEFKTIDMAPEYKTIFGKNFNRFKVPYLIRFNAKDIENSSLVTPDTQTISLLFRTTKKEVVQAWNIDMQGKVIVMQS